MRVVVSADATSLRATRARRRARVSRDRLHLFFFLTTFIRENRFPNLHNRRRTTALRHARGRLRVTVVHRALRAAGQSSTMEDADRLLLLALGRVGCSIPANVRSMADVVTENALPAMCASCLRALDASGEGAAGTGTVSPSPEPYPAEATARIRACEALAARLNAIARSRRRARIRRVGGKRTVDVCRRASRPRRRRATRARFCWTPRTPRGARVGSALPIRTFLATRAEPTRHRRRGPRNATRRMSTPTSLPRQPYRARRRAHARRRKASRRGARGAARGARRRGGSGVVARGVGAFARAGGRVSIPRRGRRGRHQRGDVQALHRDPRELRAAGGERRPRVARNARDRIAGPNARARGGARRRNGARATRAARGDRGRGEEKPARRVRRVRSFSERSRVLLKLSSESRGCVVLRCEEDVVVIEIAERGTNRVLFVARLAFL